MLALLILPHDLKQSITYFSLFASLWILSVNLSSKLTTIFLAVSSLLTSPSNELLSTDTIFFVLEFLFFIASTLLLNFSIFSYTLSIFSIRSLSIFVKATLKTLIIPIPGPSLSLLIFLAVGHISYFLVDHIIFDCVPDGLYKKTVESEFNNIYLKKEAHILLFSVRLLELGL